MSQNNPGQLSTTLPHNRVPQEPATLFLETRSFAGSWCSQVWLGWLPASPRDLPVSASLTLGLQACVTAPIFLWGCCRLNLGSHAFYAGAGDQIRFSCLQDKDATPHPHWCHGPTQNCLGRISTVPKSAKRAPQELVSKPHQKPRQLSGKTAPRAIADTGTFLQPERIPKAKAEVKGDFHFSI